MDENAIKLFGSKKTDNWQTPPEFYKKLDDEFHFNFDPCPLNPTFDGLEIDWKERCFVNPPYSKVKEFLIKADNEIKKGNSELIVFLTFANTDTNWFHSFVLGKSEIRFVKGRLKFLNGGGIKNSAMRPSILIIFKR